MRFNHEIDENVLARGEAMITRLATSADRVTAAVLKLADMISTGKITLTWETKSK